MYNYNSLILTQRESAEMNEKYEDLTQRLQETERLLKDQEHRFHQLKQFFFSSSKPAETFMAKVCIITPSLWYYLVFVLPQPVVQYFRLLVFKYKSN